MRKRIFEIIEKSEGDRVSAIYDIVIIAAIIVSLIPLAFKSENTAFFIIDKICCAVFMIDYLLRLLTADYKYQKHTAFSFIRYPFSFMALIDLISILPSLIPVNSGFKVLRVFRMFRAMRVLRVFKATRYSRSVSIILDVFRRSKEPLKAVGSLAAVYVLIAALVIFNVEPDSFDTFFDAVYWATVSLTTVGYGDIYPVTVIGRATAMISSIFGIAIVALPSGIITAGYLAAIEKRNE